MLYILAFHIISVVAWFAGLFYLPRLFVYHAQTTDEISLERFKIMERRLFKAIMNPAMILTLVFGITLLIYNWPVYKMAGWMHTKLFLVVLLLGYHHACGRFVKKFQQDTNTKSHRYYRVFNEIPTVFLIVIVILVVVKPF
jgi:protoporphyrinogen IX oxidase